MSYEKNILNKDACCQNTVVEACCYICSSIASHEKQELQTDISCLGNEDGGLDFVG